jgi:hypothetical protein
MRKFSLLVLSCSLLAGRLLADPVFTISNLTATFSGAGVFSGGGPRTTFSGSGSSDSGDSITISGFGGQFSGFIFISPGSPIGSVSYGLIGDISDCSLPLCSQTGVAEISGRFFSVQLSSSLGTRVFDAPNNLTFQPPTFTYGVPATAVGEAIAVCSNSPNCADGTVIGNVLIDLQGFDTIRFSPISGLYIFNSATFNSTAIIAEPSDISLILLGSFAVLAVVRQTRHR